MAFAHRTYAVFLCLTDILSESIPDGNGFSNNLEKCTDELDRFMFAYHGDYLPPISILRTYNAMRNKILVILDA